MWIWEISAHTLQRLPKIIAYLSDCSPKLLILWGKKPSSPLNSSLHGVFQIITNLPYVPSQHCLFPSTSFIHISRTRNVMSKDSFLISTSSLCSLFSLQVFLNTYGIQTQTPQQVEPIQIWPQQELVKVSNSVSFSLRRCIGTELLDLIQRQDA